MWGKVPSRIIIYSKKVLSINAIILVVAFFFVNYLYSFKYFLNIL